MLISIVFSMHLAVSPFKSVVNSHKRPFRGRHTKVKAIEDHHFDTFIPNAVSHDDLQDLLRQIAWESSTPKPIINNPNDVAILQNFFKNPFSLSTRLTPHSFHIVQDFLYQKSATMSLEQLANDEFLNLLQFLVEWHEVLEHDIESCKEEDQVILHEFIHSYYYNEILNDKNLKKISHLCYTLIENYCKRHQWNDSNDLLIANHILSAHEQ